MNKKKLTVLGLLLLYLLLIRPSISFGELTASQIVRKSDKLMRGRTTIGTSVMKIITPNWSRAIKMDFWSEGTTKFFIHILSPQREKDTTFLKSNTTLYQYLPSAEMRIKISPSMMHQSWMGSDFTNDDLVKESSTVEDYIHKMLGKEEIRNINAYKIQLDPKPDAPVVWGKLIIWYRQSDLVPLRQDFYDENGKKIKVLSFSRIRNIGDRNYPTKMTMIPLNKKGHKTIYYTTRIKFNKKIPRRIFTLKNLEKTR